MLVRQIDVNHDWTFGQGRNNYLSGNAAISQSINTRLSSFLGNCPFDLNTGIDWFTFLASKDQTALQLAISAVILNTAGVTGILQLGFNLNETTRGFTTTYQVQTVYSTISSIFQFNGNEVT